VGLAACSHWIAVDRARVPDLAAQYRARGQIEISDDGARTLTVTSNDRPKLRLHLARCVPYRKQRCAYDIEQKLENVTPELAANIESAELTYSGYRAVGWRPRYGVGLVLGGVAPIETLAFQVFPIRALAIELGAGFVFGTAPFDAYSGVRVRPFDFDGWRPFVGAYINILAGPNITTSRTTGARLGIDRPLFGETMLLTVELDIGYALSLPGSYVGYFVSTHVMLTGGAALAFVF
jgi:hypothetical protein